MYTLKLSIISCKKELNEGKYEIKVRNNGGESSVQFEIKIQGIFQKR